MSRAVAIDLGASSARFALGEISEGRLDFRVIEQIPHDAVRWNGHDVWDIDRLFDFCARAADYARANGAASIGIDTWGVDHGFIDSGGHLLQPPICYRDASHSAAFARIEADQPWLYAQTGIQRQPFNTLCQLLARQAETPALFAPEHRWLLLPDLLLHRLGAAAGYERSIASTTQLTDLSGAWNPAVFERFGLPMPTLEICGPEVSGDVDGLKLVRVAGHDTACAVEGLGLRAGADAGVVFANLGTWALVGAVRAGADASDAAREENFTNERTPWNEVRLLTNVPGFFILNGLHRDLGRADAVSDWLHSADFSRTERIDAFDPALFAPENMLDAVANQLGRRDFSDAEWAGIGLASLAETIADRAKALGARSIRLSGGGSRHRGLCEALARAAGVPVEVAPAESTLRGNLAIQFAALAGLSSGAPAPLPAETLEAFAV